MSGPLATAGTVIHKDGEPFATVTRDIHRGAFVQSDDFIFTSGYKPVRGERIPEPVLKVLRGYGLHTSSWRVA